MMRAAVRLARTLGIVAALGLFGHGAAMAQNDAFDDPGKAVRGVAGGAIGDLVPTAPTVDGGSISVGATAQVVVLFRNDSGQPITTGPIQLYPSSTVNATTSLNQCQQEPLPPGGSCAVSISVKALSAGDWRVEMLMRHSGRSRLVTATIAGKVEESDKQRENFSSDIESIPNEVKFGTVSSGQPVVKGVVLRNTTNDPITVNSIYIEAAEQSGFTLKTDCEKLAPGQACIVTITWSPNITGASSGVLLVEHSGPTSVASIPLDGQYTPADTTKADTFPKAVPGKGLLVSSQESVDFGKDINTGSALTVSLVNVGDAPIRLKTLHLSGGNDGLSIAKSGCVPGAVLQPVEACALTLNWSPVRQGAMIDDVQVTHDGARGVLVLPVKGAATAAISQDSKAVRLDSSGAAVTTSVDRGGRGSSGGNGGGGQETASVDPASTLDGFAVTSHSPDRAIITGPGGSRIIFNGQKVVVGGFVWAASILPAGVEMKSGSEKVLLLFDRSLNSINRSGGQSAGSATSNSAPTLTAAPTVSAGNSSAPSSVVASAPAASVSAPAASTGTASAAPAAIGLPK